MDTHTCACSTHATSQYSRVSVRFVKTRFRKPNRVLLRKAVWICVAFSINNSQKNKKSVAINSKGNEWRMMFCSCASVSRCHAKDRRLKYAACCDVCTVLDTKHAIMRGSTCTSWPQQPKQLQVWQLCRCFRFGSVVEGRNKAYSSTSTKLPYFVPTSPTQKVNCSTVTGTCAHLARPWGGLGPVVAHHSVP